MLPRRVVSVESTYRTVSSIDTRAPKTYITSTAVTEILKVVKIVVNKVVKSRSALTLYRVHTEF